MFEVSDDITILAALLSGAIMVLVGLITAIAREWLLLPMTVRQWEASLRAMERDRDYWRSKAEQEQQKTGQALDAGQDLQDPERDNDVP